MRRRRQGERLRHRRSSTVVPALCACRLPHLLRRRTCREAVARPRGLRPTRTIYVLNGLLPGTGRDLCRHSTCARCSAHWTRSTNGRRFAGAQGRGTAGRAPCRHRHEPARAAGCRGTALVARSPLLAGFRAALLMSHFVSAEEPDNPLNARQIEALRGGARKRFPAFRASLANSSGIFLPRGRITISSGPATRSTAAIRRPAAAIRCARWSARGPHRADPRGVEAARPSATTRTWTAHGARRHRDRLGRLRRRLSARRERHRREARHAVPPAGAIVAGPRCPFVGRVSMDLIAVDVTDVPDGAVERGDLVTLIGDDLTDRRGRPPRRHHRLRDPDQSRPALRPRVTAAAAMS